MLDVVFAVCAAGLCLLLPYLLGCIVSLAVLLVSSSLGVLLKYNRIIQNENRKRIFTKKKKRKILISSAISKGLENYCLRERNWVGGLGKGHPPKKRPPPPALIINY